VYVVGLTGVIGAGKSTVCDMLRDRGAIVLDSDEIVREVQRPGEDGFREIVDQFGPQVVAPDGTLDRAAMASVVFADSDKRRCLEAIVWPRVFERLNRPLADLASTDAIIIQDIPLQWQKFDWQDAVLVVAAREDTQLARLVSRGMEGADARARIESQGTVDTKLEFADYVIWNEGGMDQLCDQVEAVWRELLAAARGGG
jgi:dephospho-CoA kinase